MSHGSGTPPFGGGGFGATPPPGGGGFGATPPPGGGGFGAPPGGGGFGAPPGGGGFGATPPGGGGGFGQPPGPPGGGGESSLPRIPFTDSDLSTIKTMSTLMVATAALMGIGQFLSMVAAVAWAVVGASQRGSNSSGVGGSVFWLIAIGGMAIVLVLGAQAFRKLVDTDGADQKHLVDGLGHLRSYFVIKGVAYAVSIVLACCCCLVSMAFFGVIIAIVGAALGNIQ